MPRLRKRRRALPQPRRHVSNFRGGLDTETPVWLVRPGRCRDASNFEINLQNTYSDIPGYERFDGRPAPSGATYTVIFFGAGRTFDFDAMIRPETPRRLRMRRTSAHPWVYARELGRNAEDTARVISAPRLGNGGARTDIDIGAMVQYRDSESGSWLPGSVEDKPDVAAVLPLETVNQKLHAELLGEAADAFREEIGPVPGSGPVRGVWILNGAEYAARDDADGARVRIHKATAAGWAEVPVGQTVKTVHFRNGNKTGGTAETPDGTLTSIVQGANHFGAAQLGDISIVKDFGTWANGTAVGRIVFTAATAALLKQAANIVSENFQGTVEIDAARFNLATGGRFETVIGNMGVGDRVYGIDGVNRAFQFDGEEWIEIVTGTGVAPTRIAFHEQQIFLAFGRELWNSGVNKPFDWSSVGGSERYNMLKPITALHVEPGEKGNAALSVWTDDRVSILYGTSTLNFELVDYRAEVGAMAYTVQEVVHTLFVDAHGIRKLETVQAFGNFSHGTISSHIQSHFNTRLRAARPVGSCIVSEKNQYRVFLANGDAYYCTFKGEYLTGIMPVTLPDRPYTVHRGEDAQGRERLFFGAASGGFVYELDKGTSFDGDVLIAHMRMHPEYMGARYQGVRKKFLSTVLQAEGEGYSELQSSFTVKNEREEGRSVGFFKAVARLSPRKWDEGRWDVSRWDDAGIKPERLKLSGRADTINFTFLKSSKYFKPLTLSGLRTKFLVGRVER